MSDVSWKRGVIQNIDIHDLPLHSKTSVVFEVEHRSMFMNNHIGCLAWSIQLMQTLTKGELVIFHLLLDRWKGVMYPF